MWHHTGQEAKKTLTLVGDGGAYMYVDGNGGGADADADGHEAYANACDDYGNGGGCGV